MAKVTAEGLEVADLTIPINAPTTARQLLARHTRRTLECVLELPFEGLARPHAHALRPIAQSVRRAYKNQHTRKTIMRTLHKVHVSVLIHACDRAAKDETVREEYPARVSRLIPVLLFELARQRLLPDSGVPWPQLTYTLPWPDSEWGLDLPADIKGIIFFSGNLELVGGAYDATKINITGSDPPVIPGINRVPAYTVISPGMVLTTLDTNPLSDFEAHPDKEGNQVDLGNKAPEEWTASMHQALEWIELGLPVLAAEMKMLMQQWVPVGYEPMMHLSCSYQEAVGQAYLTLHPNPFTMMEAMVHEFQHNKVNALWTLEPLLENAFWPLYSSPVRPDPRPLHGVLLAAHAFVPVAELYIKLREAGVERTLTPDTDRRLKTIVEGNHAGMEVVREHGKFTTMGARFFKQLDEMATAHLDAIVDIKL